MMTFKDAIANDVPNVFLNFDEFGETVSIDGEEVTAVISEDSRYAAGGVNASSSGSAYGSGALEPELPSRVIVLHVKTSDISDEIQDGGSITINGELCLIAKRDDTQGGLTVLTLVRQGY